MSRNPLLEAIHEARYDLQTCAEKDNAAAREKLYVLLQQELSAFEFIRFQLSPAPWSAERLLRRGLVCEVCLGP